MSTRALARASRSVIPSRFTSNAAPSSLPLPPLLSRSFTSSSPSPPSPSPSPSPLSITAAVARSPLTPFTIERLHLRPPRSDELLIRIVSTGICHTDIAVKERNLVSMPIVLGHEGVGIVEQIGSGINSSKIAKGDRVILSYASCGMCAHCLRGKPAYCYEHGSLNFGGTYADGTTSHTTIPTTSPTTTSSSSSHTHSSSSSTGTTAASSTVSTGEPVYGSFFRQSSFSTHVLCTLSNLIRLPSSSSSPRLPLRLLAPLGCGIQTGAGAVMNTLGMRVGGEGSSIGIWGCGAVGLAAIMAAKLVRAKTIIALDLNKDRLEIAKEVGATHTIQLSSTSLPTDTVQYIHSIIGSFGLSYALDTSGHPSSLESAFLSLAPLGVAGLIAGSSSSVSIDMSYLLQGRQLRGIIQGDSVSQLMIPEMLEWNERGWFPFEKMIREYDGLEEVNQAVWDIKNGGKKKGEGGGGGEGRMKVKHENCIKAVVNVSKE